MSTHFCRLALLVALSLTAGAGILPAQQRQPLTPEQIESRWKLEKELQTLAIVERKVMVPMRDGVRLATDIYRPKDVTGRVPTVWVRTPYNFNFWDVRNGVPADMTAALTAVKRGYAYVVQNERGHFFSEGSYDILGAPLTDGSDALAWISAQPWSNGKVGTTGCSSTAEYQMAVASQGHPAFAAMNVQGFGAGVGRVGPYYEQGNWYRGGAVQMLFISWIYGQQNQVRPMFPPNTPREDLVRASKSFDLAPQLPPVDWSKALWHLPVQDILANVDGPRGIFADAMPVETGGRMIQRTPNDPAWYKAACTTIRCRSRYPACGSCRGTTCRSAPTSRSTTMCARRPRPRSRTTNGPSSRRSCIVASPAPPRTPSSASAAWATRVSTTRRSSTASSTGS